MNGPHRRLASLTAVALAAALALPASAGPAGAPTPPVGRSFFVPNVSFGHLALSTTRPVHPPRRPVDGRLAGWNAGVHPPGLEGTTGVQAGELVYEGYLLGDDGAASSCVVGYYDQMQPVADASQAAGWERYDAIQSALGAELIGDVDEAGAFDRPPLKCEKGSEDYGAANYPKGATPGAADIVQW